MKCPHCEYKHGWDGKSMSDVEGKQGDFYTLPVEMEQYQSLGSWHGDTRRTLYACPSCGIDFIKP